MSTFPAREAGARTKQHKRCAVYTLSAELLLLRAGDMQTREGTVPEAYVQPPKLAVGRERGAVGGLVPSTPNCWQRGEAPQNMQSRDMFKRPWQCTCNRSLSYRAESSYCGFC